MRIRYAIGNRKKTAVFFSFLIILLCLTIIVGLTYALFTSDDKDGKIGINVTSGKCKIDIVDTEDQTLVGDVLHFVNDDGNTKIYFEPGATYYTEGFQVKNVGTIPVNFRLYISEDKDENMDKFHDAFEFWITTDPHDLETAEPLTFFKGDLEKDQTSDVYYLVIRMKESAGNYFQNKIYSGIGVTVYAVQGNAEKSN